MTEETVINERDAILKKLESYTRNVLVVVFGLLPLFFLPLSAAPFGYTKILFALAGVLLALILFSLSVLRAGSLSIQIPKALIALWVVFLVALISSLLSGDFKDSFVGDFFSVHSTAFVGVLALVATVWSLVRSDKAAVLRMYVLLSASTVVLVIFHIIRLFFGQNTLSFGVFLNSVSTPIGGWNDLALFLGLVILISIIALELLPLTKWGRWLFGAVSLLSLVMLAVINFIYIWFVLGIVSLVMLVYVLKKPSAKSVERELFSTRHQSVSSLSLLMVVLVTSVFFIIGGSAVGDFINSYSNISYVEVRPSLEATADVAAGVYRENAFLGTGANKFSDAWRVHKNEAINNTIFWTTNFNAGNGYLPTFLITTGILGGIAWIAFLVLFVIGGVRMLIGATSADRMWYFIGLSSFVTALYIWCISIVYVPGATVLIIGALCTGIAFLAQNELRPGSRRHIEIGRDRRTGFILTLAVILVIIGSVSTLYVSGRHFAAAYAFNQSVALAASVTTIDDVASVEAVLLRAYELSESDLFSRRIAEYQLARMNALLATEAPTEAERTEFNQALANGIQTAETAIEHDETEPANWDVLGNIYSLLVASNVEGAYERGFDALTRARELDPKNPARLLSLANLEARSGNLERAQQLTEDAIRLKRNYSDAYFFLTQVAVARGNLEEAIAASRSVIELEPQNAARYYQLGVLYSADGNTEAAATAFEEALRLDPDYANAMYFLALAYDALGRVDEARTQLERVLELNPGNADVISLLQQIETNGSIGAGLQVETPIVPTETAEEDEEGDEVITTEDPDSSLITPVNIPPSSDSREIENEPAAESEEAVSQ